MGDFLGVLLTAVLLAANAFFVGAEFALISARRDRLEALAEQGKHSAVTVIRAGENLPLMLAGAQLGITVCSILLGRVGEPAVAHLLEKPFHLLGIPDTVLHTVSFVIAITIVVVLHVLLGEMVPKNIAIAGPESAAMLLVPPYLVWVRAARPVIAIYDWCAHMILRAVGVEAKTELENTVSTVELSEMIAESLSEGLLDPDEHNRLSRALRIRNRVVAEVAVPLSEVRAVPVAADRSEPDGGGDPERTGGDRLLALPGGRSVGPVHRLRPHQGRAADRRRPGCGGRTDDGAAPPGGGRDDLAARRTLACCGGTTAIWRWSPPPTAACRRWSRSRTWSKTSLGPSGTGPTVPDVGLRERDWTVRRADAPETGRRVLPAPSQARAGGRGPPGVGLPVHLLQPAAPAVADLAPRFRRGARRRDGRPLSRSQRLRARPSGCDRDA